MSMEKNGAISSSTPGCENDCGCAKQANEMRQGEFFPKDVATADAIDGDLTKQAVDAVQQRSKPAN
jgi:hypothetical protein